jgi:hypothetical protein
MNEREFTTKIKESLNYGSARLRPEVFKGLEAARKRAMDAYEPAHAHAFHWAGAHGGRTQARPHQARRWVSLAMLLVLLAGMVYWQQEIFQEEDVDAALLSGDLPVDAYLDHGFQAWLDRSSQR